jgi:hypothetical protein
MTSRDRGALRRRSKPPHAGGDAVERAQREQGGPGLEVAHGKQYESEGRVAALDVDLVRPQADRVGVDEEPLVQRDPAAGAVLARRRPDRGTLRSHEQGPGEAVRPRRRQRHRPGGVQRDHPGRRSARERRDRQGDRRVRRRGDRGRELPRRDPDDRLDRRAWSTARRGCTASPTGTSRAARSDSGFQSTLTVSALSFPGMR